MHRFAQRSDFHLRLAFERIFAVGIVGMRLIGQIALAVFQVDRFGKRSFNSHVWVCIDRGIVVPIRIIHTILFFIDSSPVGFFRPHGQ